MSSGDYETAEAARRAKTYPNCTRLSNFSGEMKIIQRFLDETCKEEDVMLVKESPGDEFPFYLGSVDIQRLLYKRGPREAVRAGARGGWRGSRALASRPCGGSRGRPPNR